MNAPRAPHAPSTLLIAALGGEGGGVLAGWIVACARRAGLPVQATSVPGVAQRTGSTSYYLEWLPEPAPPGREPVFALSPVAGEVDWLVASEALEAARTIERGFVSPQRTTLITSTHRVYTTLEKMHGGDGRFDTARIVEAGAALARRFVALDVDALAQRHRTVPSAVLFGALAGAGAFPWSRAASEAAIREAGRGVEASLAGFAAAFDTVARAAAGAPAQPPADAASGTAASAVVPPVAARWAPRVAALPAGARGIAAHALARLRDWQDEAWADDWLAHAERLAALPGLRADALAEALRRLALWMTWEDIPRVADLKSRPERLGRLRASAGATDRDIVTVTEHFKPRREEIAAMLPARLGRWWLARPGAAAPRARRLRTTDASGWLALRLLAAGRLWRRGSLRHAEETQAIAGWLERLARAAAQCPDYAAELARLPTLRRGYGDTHARGCANWTHLLAHLVDPALARGATPDDARMLARAIDAALADPEGPALRTALAGAGVAAPPAVAHPIRIVRRPTSPATTSDPPPVT